MKSNYQMLLSIQEWKPREFGFLYNDEIMHIRNVFKIYDRTDVELQNLRDFVVMYYSLQFTKDKPTLNDSGKMRGICYVIDCEKVKRGIQYD